MLKKFVSVMVCVITSQQNFMSWLLGLNLRNILLLRGNMNNGDRRRVNGEAEEDEEEEEGNEDLEAWERAYADERSWEALQEDESGLLRPIDNNTLYHAQYRRRIRSLSSLATTARIQKGLIRYLCIVVDLSKVSYS
jgi:transcription initiation factor TFIIH subunit 2